MAKYAANTSGAMWWTNLHLMQVAPSGGQTCNLCKWPHLVAKFAHNASGAILLLDLIKVMESISGFLVPLEMFFKVNRESQNSVFAMLCWETKCEKFFSKHLSRRERWEGEFSKVFFVTRK